MTRDERLRAAIADDLATGTEVPGIDAAYLARQMDPDDVVAVLEEVERERDLTIASAYFTRLVGAAVGTNPNRRAYEERDDSWPGRRR